jgi:hypothetical protein
LSAPLDEEDKSTLYQIILLIICSLKINSKLSLINQYFTLQLNNLRMLTLHPQYIIDNIGEKISVVLPLTEFKILMEALEELEDIKLYDEAIKAKETSILIDEAFKMIEAKHKSS